MLNFCFILIAMFLFLIPSNALISLSPEASFGVTECCGDCCLYIIPGELTINTLQPLENPYIQDFLVVDVSSVSNACFDGDILSITSQSAREGGTDFIKYPITPNTIDFSLKPNGYEYVRTNIVTGSSAPLSGYDQFRIYKGPNMCGAIPINIEIGETNNEQIGYIPLRFEDLNAEVDNNSTFVYSIIEESNLNSIDISGSSIQDFIFVEGLKINDTLVLGMNSIIFDPSSLIVPLSETVPITLSIVPGAIDEFGNGELFVSLVEIQTDRGIIKIPIAIIVYQEGLAGVGYLSKSVSGMGIFGFVLVTIFSLMILFFVDRKKKVV